MDDLGQILSYIAPAVVVIGGARWLVGVLWVRFDRKLNENRDVVMAAIGEFRAVQIRQDARIDRHDERIAWLEGAAGQPLHSHQETK